MKRFFAVVAVVFSVTFFASCEKEVEIADTRAFIVTETVPAIAQSGVPANGGSYDFFVMGSFDWDIVHDDVENIVTDNTLGYYIPEYTLDYDGYTVTRYSSRITVDIDPLLDLQYRNIVVDFISSDGELKAQWSTEQFGIGEGTKEIPFFYSSASDIRNLALTVNSEDGSDCEGIYYKMICDIDLGCDDDNTWETIGVRDYPFKGHFDGGGYKISGLYIYADGVGYQGLFGYIGEGSTISNLGVYGDIFVNSTVQDSTDNTLTNGSGANYNIGGIVGYSNEGDITNCYNKCNVRCFGVSSGKFGENVGGVVGYNYGGYVTNCYNAGSVTGINNFVGGITGWNKGKVENCYNIGTVTSTSILVGGIAGGSAGSSSVENCYTMSGTVIDGVVSANVSSASFVGIDGTVKSSSYMSSAVFVSDLAGSIWRYDSYYVNGGYPIFSWQK